MVRTDDLQFQGLRILQDTAQACFSEDAVLLCNFLKLTAADRVVDLGAGNGIVSILGQGKTGAAFTGVEKQEYLTQLASQSAALNGQDIRFLCMDVCDAPFKLGHGRFTAAVMNPPYFAAGEAGGNASRAMARHAAPGTTDDFLKAAFLLLNNGGKLFCCYPAAQLADLLCALRANRLEPKRCQMVMPTAADAPKRVLIEAKKDGKPGIAWETPLLTRKNP